MRKKRVRWIRVISIEGPEEWVDVMKIRSYLPGSYEKLAGNGTLESQNIGTFTVEAEDDDDSKTDPRTLSTLPKLPS
jgi:hypothetical protein